MRSTRFNQENENSNNSSKKIIFKKVKKQAKRNYTNSAQIRECRIWCVNLPYFYGFKLVSKNRCVSTSVFDIIEKSKMKIYQTIKIYMNGVIIYENKFI